MLVFLKPLGAFFLKKNWKILITSDKKLFSKYEPTRKQTKIKKESTAFTLEHLNIRTHIVRQLVTSSFRTPQDFKKI